MKIIGMIPARLGSKRVKKKNLRLLGDIPLVDYIIKSARAVKYFDEILSKYDKHHTLNFSGSIAFYFKSYILKIGEERGYEIGKIISSPIDGICRFHSK